MKNKTSLRNYPSYIHTQDIQLSPTHPKNDDNIGILMKIMGIIPKNENACHVSALLFQPI